MIAPFKESDAQRIGRSMTTRSLVLGCLMFGTIAGGLPAAAPKKSTASKGSSVRDTSQVLVTVNGTPITENRLAFYDLLNHVPETAGAEGRKQRIEQLVENELLRQFLADRRAEVDPKRLAAAVEAIKNRLRADKLDPEKTLRNLGYSDNALRRDFSLPIAWEYHLGRVLTQQSIRDEFDRHRSQYDGTEVRASQIFIKSPASDPESKRRAAEEKLRTIREQIVAGKIGFAEAARRDSEAPSREQGGDVGFFPFRGVMPPEVSRVAFSLKPGEVSQPFRTRFGVHLYTVTAVRPGNLDLEDVRSQVIARLSKELRDQLLGQARAHAKIEWRTAAQ